MAEQADVIVLGVGAMGSAACWELARRGAKVVGIERFTVGHARGSSHGETRLIRQAYFEHPDYVPLLKSAYGLWREIEKASGKRLFTQTGLVLFGPEEAPTIRGAQLSAKLYDVPIDVVGRSAAAAVRWPEFRVAPGDIAVYEPTGGLLAVEDCIKTMAGLAKARGARIVENTTASAWSRGARGVVVTTDQGAFEAPKLVVTAGAWSADLLPQVAGMIDVRRVPVAWFEPRAAVPAGMPCFGFEAEAGFFYGFPPQTARGVKIGLHVAGERVTDPLTLDRTLREDDARPLEDFVAAHLPWLEPRVKEHSVCMYSLSPDQHFIIDQDGAALTYAAGFSGHGFKFASVIGAVLADLALHGDTPHPIGFLRHDDRRRK
jgi:sarcosine oxidase